MATCARSCARDEGCNNLENTDVSLPLAVSVACPKLLESKQLLVPNQTRCFLNPVDGFIWLSACARQCIGLYEKCV